MYIGLDLGTSGLRALVVDEDGRTVTSAESVYQTTHPKAGWSEQDPALWIEACKNVFAELQQNFGRELSALRGVGISGHMHGAVLLGTNNRVLRDCILWNDTRSHEEAAQLDRTPNVRELSGNIVFPGFTSPKLMWVAKNEPKVFDQLETILLPKDYLRLWLTGELGAEISDAAGTSWLDVGDRGWSPELIEASGITANLLPPLLEGTEQAGHVRTELSRQWGIEGKTIVVGGGADNASAACGAGVLGEGQGFVSLGTSGVILAGRQGYAPKPQSAVHTFCHAVPGHWYQMGVTLAATDSLNWLARISGQEPKLLTDTLGDALAEPSLVSFLPYLSGERTPHNDSKIRGAFLGLDIGHSTSELTQAVLQGVTFSLRQSLEALCSANVDLQSLLAMGGGSKSDYWVQMLATAFNMTIELPEQGDYGAALGAARLAICGATGAGPNQIMLQPTVARIVEPRADLIGPYDAAYRKFKEIYPAIREVQ